MPTLKAILEEVAGLGPGYLIADHGSYWVVTDLLERLEREAPERLTYLVSWEVLEGAIYASDDREEVLSPVPLYQIHRLTHSSDLPGFPESEERPS